MKVLEVQSKMCTAAMRSALEDTPVPSKKDSSADQGALDENDLHEYDKVDKSTTDMQKLFDNINAIVGSFPRQDEVSVEIDKSVPKIIGCDDLLLFRAVLNLLTHCMGSSKEGDKCGVRMRRMKKDDDTLLVQCLLGGSPISKQAAKELFDNRDSLLAPVASIVRSMGGHYGMYEAKWNAKNSHDSVQSIFWLQIPYETPENPRTFRADLVHVHAKLDPETLGKLATDANLTLDPFRAALLEQGCGRVPVR
jgi:hypothetical protein